MARGGRRGQGSGRGKSRTGDYRPKGDKVDGRGTPVAQSGGKSSSWADTHQGRGTIGGAGGSRGQGVVASGRMANGNKYKVRGPGGDKTARPNGQSVKHGAPTALSGNPHPKVSGSTSVPYPTLHGVPRGKGGSNG